MDTFLKVLDATILNQEDINHPNRSIVSNETDRVIKSPPNKKAQDQMDLLPHSAGP
jgi:hypothetical protein